MPTRTTIAAVARMLTEPLASTTVVDREGVRTRLVFAALAVEVIAAAVFPSEIVDWRLWWVAVTGTATIGVVSLVPGCWTILNRVGGVLLVAVVTVLVAATGGADSPHRLFYGMLLVYATMFYGTRRLAVTAALLLAVSLAPHVGGIGHQTADHWAALTVELGMWGAVATVIHGLMSRLRAQTAALEASEQQYRSLFSENPDAVFALDVSGCFTSINAAGARLIGAPAERVLGTTCFAFVPPEEVPMVLERFELALGGASQAYEVTIVDVAEHRTPASVVNFPILVDGEVIGVHGVLKDISDRRALEEELTHAALHDPLTDLANRALLALRLQHALDASTRSGEPVGLLAFDLDGFKAVNDTHGHAAGDALLVEVATRLSGASRPGDTLARLGGDEFAFVLVGADRGGSVEAARRVMELVTSPTTIDGATVTVGASIGIAVSDPASTVDQLLRAADAAMYEAKRRGRGRVELHRAELDEVRCDTVAVDAADARCWAGYMRALRSDIAASKRAGTLPGGTRAPASVHRVLQSILATIDALPVGGGPHQMRLPERVALEEFVFHQAMVHAWADDLVAGHVLATSRPSEADAFWSRLEAAVDRRAEPVPLQAQPVG